ncbi:hypothetical protein V2J09_015465 [Rumex salicifolius]
MGGWCSKSKRSPKSTKKRLERKFSRIADNYTSLQDVTEALSRAGLESSNLIVGIDFTKSNEKSFQNLSLHHLGSGFNPYEQAISVIGKTLSAFDEDNSIPSSTHDQKVFSFYHGERYCNGFEVVLTQYREIVPRLQLAGPTSFAPVIEMAIKIVEESGGQYHVLLIIADGQVTKSSNTQRGQRSPQEQKTIDAIPLSIVLVGVGDGPWDMKEFDDNIPAKRFDNFQFVNFTEIMAKNVSETRKQTEFALSALMEIPSQYKATIELNLLGNKQNPIIPKARHDIKQHHCLQIMVTAMPTHLQACSICVINGKDMASGCSHQNSFTVFHLQKKQYTTGGELRRPMSKA